ncbi:MAG: hypothetical protein JXA71_05080, partial [Chitinispirillaceae bacterium]|nr:hypothetical protein [Chitinispirillaceae bacterium]
EPAVALDVGAYEHLKRLVKTAGDRGATFLISSHQLEAIDDMCSRVGILRDGRLTELTKGDGMKGAHWVIDIDHNRTWAEIIGSVCGTEPQWNGDAWHVTISDPLVTVPLLVRRLVEAGCDIRRVAPVDTGFSDTIRRHYREDAS